MYVLLLRYIADSENFFVRLTAVTAHCFPTQILVRISESCRGKVSDPLEIRAAESSQCTFVLSEVLKAWPDCIR